ncbi:hypothetical protein GCM10009804_35760 [Kribbella hippodromi]|uniref:Uncharacterized protein n=1 Tax=Kribbella hippodromi TaxID=434347 RepID=A0ABN2DEK5_9ACTN
MSAGPVGWAVRAGCGRVLVGWVWLGLAGDRVTGVVGSARSAAQPLGANEDATILRTMIPSTEVAP